MLAASAAPSAAGTVIGKLELPPADRPPVVAKGFLDRSENPLAEVKKPNLAPYFIVALEGGDGPPSAPAEVSWDVVGESFSRPVIGVPTGAQVVIHNLTKVPRSLVAAEDPKLIAGPLNPTGSKSFRAGPPATFTIRDHDAPYLRGQVVVVATGHVTTVDDTGRFELADVPDGTYKLRVFYADPAGRAGGWLATTTEVTVAGKKSGKTEVTAKVSASDLAGTPAAGPGKK
ncbi:MAG TPA: hypothetical protein VFP84_16820 [Kofleriaceae bacterium]|nr:hypothetical protein [Kofleriaceae bacterium]